VVLEAAEVRAADADADTAVDADPDPDPAWTSGSSHP